MYAAVRQAGRIESEGELVVGVTSIDDMVFVLRFKERDQLEVYDAVTFRLQRRLTVPDARGFTDMASCEHNRCVYIADHVDKYIHKLEVHLHKDNFTGWPIDDERGEPRGLSVNTAEPHNVLVACPSAGKIKEFSTYGNIVRDIVLPRHVVNACHARELPSGQLIVCHGDINDPVHGVSMKTSAEWSTHRVPR